jgi:hypothetical protein
VGDVVQLCAVPLPDVSEQVGIEADPVAAGAHFNPSA